MDSPSRTSLLAALAAWVCKMSKVQPCRDAGIVFGEVAERLKAHAWKVCVR